MSKKITMQIGKYKCTGSALNEPSEEAILECRKIVTRIMNEYYKSNKSNESNKA